MLPLHAWYEWIAFLSRRVNEWIVLLIFRLHFEHGSFGQNSVFDFDLRFVPAITAAILAHIVDN